MEEKKQIKISLKKAILILIGIILIIFVLCNILALKNNTRKPKNSKDYKAVSVEGKIYYQRLSKNTWKGKYHQEEFYTEEEIDNIMEVVSYTDY